jgi:hypothetical protein
MMAYEQRDMNGSAFKNKRKERDSQPGYTGTVMIRGEEMWINMWYKGKDKNGDPWFSFSFTEKKPRQDQSQQSSSTFDDDSDVPF